MAAAVVTYVYPITGLVAPTAAQVQNVSEVVCDVVFGVGDTVATITHNLGTNATGADGTPEIQSIVTAAGSALNQPVFAITNANALTITQTLGSANTNATYRVRVKRPHSLTR